MGPLSRIPPRAPARHTRLDSQTKAKRHAREKADAEAAERDTAIDNLEAGITGDPRFSRSLTTDDTFGLTGGQQTGDIGGPYNNLSVRAGRMNATWFPFVGGDGRVLPGEVSIRFANFPPRDIRGTTRNALPFGVAVDIDEVYGGILAGRVNQGVFAAARIPGLPAGKITSGVFAAARIPGLPASKTTSGTFDKARIPALGLSDLNPDLRDDVQNAHRFRKIGTKWGGVSGAASADDHGHSISFKEISRPERLAALYLRERIERSSGASTGEVEDLRSAVRLLMRLSFDDPDMDAWERERRIGEDGEFRDDFEDRFGPQEVA